MLPIRNSVGKRKKKKIFYPPIILTGEKLEKHIKKRFFLLKNLFCYFCCWLTNSFFPFFDGFLFVFKVKHAQPQSTTDQKLVFFRLTYIFRKWTLSEGVENNFTLVLERCWKMHARNQMLWNKHLWHNALQWRC